MEAKQSSGNDSSYSKATVVEGKDPDRMSRRIPAESKEDPPAAHEERKPTETDVSDPLPVISVSPNPRAQAIVDGFRITRMSMRDADSGCCMWESEDNQFDNMFAREQAAHVPASILDCAAVTREIVFASDEEMRDFMVEQRVFYMETCIETWEFKFGFVIPGSTNSWEQTIVAAKKEDMIPHYMLNGNVKIETRFYDGPLFVSASVVRIFYDA